MTDVPRTIETVVIGAGQAGLMSSWHLQQAGREHVVLDRRATLGGGWQDRWDAFTLVSPNWLSGMPGFPYDGPDPDGFMGRDAIATRVRRYAEAIDAPVHRSVEVSRVGPGAGSHRFRLTTSAGPIDADAVVVATGAFQSAHIPPAGAGFSSRIYQLHSHDYRNPGALPSGGVLIVGSGQTGVQLAEELHAAGRRVVLATGRCGRYPRRYRGYDIFWWARQLAEHGDAAGTPMQTVGQLADPRLRYACNAHLSGHDGGHDTNLRQMALDGIGLTGRFLGGDGEHATFAPDLADHLEFADRYFDEGLGRVCERYAVAAGVPLQDDDRAWPTHRPPEVERLDLAAEGIDTVLWTTGYARDYAWIDFPILDEFGAPRQVRGISEVPGLSFLGMIWQHNSGSANMIGMHVDAAHLAAHW